MRRTVLCWTLVAGLASAAHADERAAPRACTTDDVAALMRALDDHPRLRSATATADAIRGRARAAAAAPDPALFVEARGVPVSEPLNLGRTPMGGVQVGAQAKVPWLPRLWALEDGRAADARAVETEADEVRLDLAARALSVSVDAALIDAQVGVLEDQAALLTSLSAVARANATVGAGRQTDAILLEARAARLQSRVVALRAQERALDGRWRGVVGDRPPLACRVEDALLTDAGGANASLDERLQKRPFLQALDDRKDAARSLESAALQTWVPEPTLRAGYVWRPDPAGVDGVDFVAAMVSVPLPVLPARRLGPLAAARAKATGADADRAAFLREAEGTHAALVGAIDAEDQRIDALEKTARPVAQGAAEVALATYRGGQGPLVDVLEAERTILEIELALAEARARRTHARLQLWRLEGGALESQTPKATDDAAP